MGTFDHILWEMTSVINLNRQKVQLRCKSTNGEYVFGQDKDGNLWEYEIATGILSPASPENRCKCADGYTKEGVANSYVLNDGSGGIIPQDFCPRRHHLSKYYVKLLELLCDDNVSPSEIIKATNVNGKFPGIKFTRIYGGGMTIEINGIDFTFRDLLLMVDEVDYN